MKKLIFFILVPIIVVIVWLYNWFKNQEGKTVIPSE